MKVHFAVCALALALMACGSQAAQAAVSYNTFTSYLTGQDPYNANPDFGSTGVAGGTVSAVLNYSGAGPLGGVFDFSGSGEAAVGALRTRAAITLTDYSLGSYYLVITPGFDYLPRSGFAQSSVTDQVVVAGAAPTYDVRFDYHLTGTTDRPPAYESYFRPLVFAAATFADISTGTTVGFDGTAFYPTPGIYDSMISFTARNIPSNTTFDLRQVLQVVLFSADSTYITDIDPFQTGDWDQSHIVSQTNLVGENPYTLSYSGDFSHTLELQNVAILDSGGSVAAGAVMVSQNGVRYPGQTAPIPEPATYAMLLAGMGLLGFAAHRRKQQG